MGELPEATPIPTPEVWRIQYSSEMRVILPILHQCIENQPNIGLSVKEYVLSVEVDYSADFIFHWGEIDPKDYSAYVLDMDEIHIVVNAMNPIDTLSLSQVEAIFSGEIKTWAQLQISELGDIHAWVYPGSSQIRELSLGQFPGIGYADLDAWISPDVEVMRQQITQDANAVGFIPGIWLDNDLKVLQISSDSVMEGKIPLVVLMRPKLDEKETEWIMCIQESWVYSAND